MQEHSNQVGKIILNPQLTTEEKTWPQRDYFSEAEKIVNEKRQKEEAERNSLLAKFRFPGATELAHDISPEEKAREALERRKREVEEQQQKMLEQQQQLLPQPITIPAAFQTFQTQPTVIATAAGTFLSTISAFS